MQTRTLGIIAGILVLAFLVGFGFMAFDMYKTLDEKQDEFKECEKLEGCKEFKCKADNALVIDWKTNYLLQYQNCLLEKEVQNV